MSVVECDAMSSLTTPAFLLYINKVMNLITSCAKSSWYQWGSPVGMSAVPREQVYVGCLPNLISPILDRQYYDIVQLQLVCYSALNHHFSCLR